MKKQYALFLSLIVATTVFWGCTFKKTPATQNAPTWSETAVQEPEGYIDERENVISVESSGSETIAGEMTNSGITSTGDLVSIAAINSGNKDSCKSLPIDEREYCLDMINFNAATFANDYSKCDLVEDSKLQGECVRMVSEGIYQKAGTLSGCTKIRDVKLRTECENKVRALLNPTSQKSCETLSNPSDKLQCFDQLILADVRSGKTTDAKVCARVVNPVLKKECEAIIKKSAMVQSTASKTAVSSGCSDKTGTNLQYCLKEAAVSSGNISSCSSITDASIKAACIKDIENAIVRKTFDEALAKNDAAICDKISDATMKSRCKEIVSQ